MQHLPILCALKKIPVAVVASTPEMLGSASAPFRRSLMGGSPGGFDQFGFFVEINTMLK